MNQSLWLLFLLFSVDTFCTASTRIRGSTQRIYDPYLKIPMAFKLECLTANDMTPSEGVVWRRTSGDGLPDTASTNNPLTLSDLQQFRDNPHSFEDRYTCTYGGITSNPVSVYVLPKPTRQDDIEQTATVGERETIECPLLFGNLRTNYTVSWTENGHTITNGSEGYLIRRDPNESLIISNVTPEHMANYQCTANLFGLHPMSGSVVQLILYRRALYSIDNCQHNIGTCINNYPFGLDDDFILNGIIDFDNIGILNLTDEILDTSWELILNNKTTRRLTCHPPGSSCPFNYPEFSIVTNMSNDLLGDEAMIHIHNANFNFNITHTFYTEYRPGTVTTKLFTFQYSPRERIIPYGQSFNIECQNSSQGVDRWTQDSNNITADTVGIDPSTITSRILHVQSMSLQLEGRYQCYTANSEPLDTINVYVIGRAVHMTVDCQASIRNNFTFVPGSGLTLDSRIRYEEIGELNLKEDVIETFWRLLLPNSEPQELICHPPGTQCLFVNDFLSIIIDMSNNRLDDTAMINISDANFDFDISHTFVTQNQLGTGNTEIKVFTFYYSLTTLTALYGLPLSIDCRNDGHAIAYWKRNDKRIYDSTPGYDSTTITSRSLHITSMTLALVGQYQCFTVDNPDIASDTFNVSVIGRALYLVKYPTYVNYTEQGNNFTLNCSILFGNDDGLNHKEIIDNTFWTIDFTNGTTMNLNCPPGNHCITQFATAFTIHTNMSDDHLSDIAIIIILDADFNFTVIHTFITAEAHNRAKRNSTKAFHFHYLQTTIPPVSIFVSVQVTIPTVQAVTTTTTSNQRDVLSTTLVVGIATTFSSATTAQISTTTTTTTTAFLSTTTIVTHTNTATSLARTTLCNAILPTGRPRTLTTSSSSITTTNMVHTVITTYTEGTSTTLLPVMSSTKAIIVNNVNNSGGVNITGIFAGVVIAFVAIVFIIVVAISIYWHHFKKCTKCYKAQIVNLPLQARKSVVSIVTATTVEDWQPDSQGNVDSHGTDAITKSPQIDTVPVSNDEHAQPSHDLTKTNTDE